MIETVGQLLAIIIGISLDTFILIISLIAVIICIKDSDKGWGIAWGILLIISILCIFAFIDTIFDFIIFNTLWGWLNAPL